ncbi:C40 family peptidase [Cohnella sp. GCM10020058]|uniref:C40 family peptidase n=1 Tax=Cohnella sp. GCM10020058 TaxID=3317330 RepID=UPI003632FA9D
MLRKRLTIATAGLLAASAIWTALPAADASAANATDIGSAWTFGGMDSTPDASAGGTADASADGTTASSSDVEKIIAEGMRYIGTPYEYGSDRNTDATFDCSDFVKWIYYRAAGIELPSDSRSQGDYVKKKGTVTSDWRELKRGDLMFFMSYRGTSASAYGDAVKSNAEITHVAIYLGDGKMLQTYSKDSGGVRTDTIDGTTWEKRYLFGGSAL